MQKYKEVESDIIKLKREKREREDELSLPCELD